MSKWKTDIDDDHVTLEFDGKPGYITIKAEDEGFVVDIWPDAGNESDASTYSYYQDLEEGEEE